jgi:hypothetical protein
VPNHSAPAIDLKFDFCMMNPCFKTITACNQATPELKGSNVGAGQVMLNAITPVQVQEFIVLLEQLSEARKARAAEGKKQTPHEIVDDPRRRQLTDYLYALSDEARKELIALMLLGRGDFDHSYQRAMETCSRYTNADDQVIYLMGKTVRLAEYLSIGLEALGRDAEAQER